ncbi:unnamed protein product [Rhizophagus irregularis]|nr:unnamed protein product [Rhizophagus irregularis]
MFSFQRFPCRNILSSFRLSDDFGGSSAFQQGDFDVSFSLEKEISVFNFFSTWDFDGRSLKGTLRIPSDQLYD